MGDGEVLFGSDILKPNLRVEVRIDVGDDPFHPALLPVESFLLNLIDDLIVEVAVDVGKGFRYRSDDIKLEVVGLREVGFRGISEKLADTGIILSVQVGAEIAAFEDGAMDLWEILPQEVVADLNE